MNVFRVQAMLLAGLASSLYGVDGVILIDQNRALAGNVTPGDTPGFPVIITQPGSYRLSGNLTVPDGRTTAIEISSDSVTLDLNGFSLIGPVDCSGAFPCTGASGAGDIGAGIKAGAFSGRHYFNITVRNGTIQGMGGNGIMLIGDSLLVEHMHVRSNGFHGIYANRNLLFGPQSQTCVILRHNTTQRNGQDGIVLGAGLVTDNVASQNNKYGISVTLEGSVSRNVANGNGSHGLLLSPYVSYSGNAIISNNGSQVASSQVDGGINLGQNQCGLVACP